jgi:hypothetical protein
LSKCSISLISTLRFGLTIIDCIGLLPTHFITYSLYSNTHCWTWQPQRTCYFSMPSVVNVFQNVAVFFQTSESHGLDFDHDYRCYCHIFFSRPLLRSLPVSNKLYSYLKKIIKKCTTQDVHCFAVQVK